MNIKINLKKFILLIITLLFIRNVKAEIFRFATLEWDQVSNTSIYETEVQNKATGELQYFKSKESVIELKLVVGNFKVRMRSYDLRGAPGKWGAERGLDIYPPDIKVKNKVIETVVNQNNDVNYEFKWEPIDKKIKYNIYVEDVTLNEIKNYTVTDENFVLELNNRNEYRWWVVAVINNIEGLKPEVVNQLILKGDTLDLPNLDIPSDGYVEQIYWSEVENAELYEYETYIKKKNDWAKIELGPGIIGDRYVSIPKDFKGGNYKIKIRALAKYANPSKWQEQTFFLKNGDRSKNALQSFLLKTSLFLPTNKYFVASYLLTSIDYTSKYIFTNVNFKAIGGTGRLGMGYIKPHSSFGVYGIGDMSGFTIYGKSRTYKSIEIHGFYRKKFDFFNYRISGGVFIRDLPELSSQNSSGTEAQFNSVSVLGPQIGFEYWKVFTTKLGLQINARYYHSVVGLQIPDQQKIVSTPSYQIGLLGSLKLTPNIMGLAGYAYRKDQISYKVKPGSKDIRANGRLDSGSETNTITVQGHYLNLVLELGF